MPAWRLFIQGQQQVQHEAELFPEPNAEAGFMLLWNTKYLGKKERSHKYHKKVDVLTKVKYEKVRWKRT